MRAVSVLFALAFAVGHAITAFLLIFLATFPFENQSPEDAAEDDWLIGVAAIVCLVGVVAALGLLLRRSWSGAAYGLAGVVDLALLVWALDVSEHSDGKVLLWGVGVGFTGLAALATSWHTRRS